MTAAMGAAREKLPLVSVVVATFQTGATVAETLDSILAQTYPQLELIITDDGSTDGTRAIVEGWLDEHRRRFVAARLLLSERNTGTTANLNRGMAATQGAYIRIIAGDDRLTETSVEDCVQAARSNNADWVMGPIVCFSTDAGQGAKAEEYTAYFAQVLHNARQATPEEQYRMLLRANWISAVGANFFSRRLYDTIGSYDEAYFLMEDYPFWVRAYQRGFYPRVIARTVAEYRVSESSVCNATGETRRRFIEDETSFYKSVIRPLLRQKRMYRQLRARDIEMLRRRLLGRVGESSLLYRASRLLRIFALDEVLAMRKQRARERK